MPTIAAPDRQHVEDFMASVAPSNAIHQTTAFISYLAVRDKGGRPVLVKARMFLASSRDDRVPLQFDCATVIAGRFALAELGITAQKLIDEVLDGQLPTPSQAIMFAPKNDGSYSAYRTPFHEDGLSRERRLELLSITGGPKWDLVKQPTLDWELKAAETPFDGLAELMGTLRLGAVPGDATEFDVVAPTVVEVDLAAIVEGTDARPGVRLYKGLDRAQCALGYRVMLKGLVVDRGRIGGDKMHWIPVDGEDYEIGTGNVQIPMGAVIHCMASFGGVAYHHGWVIDPACLQNPLRAVYEVFDPDMLKLNENCDLPGSRGTNAREFEFAISWILSLMGFRVMVLGSSKNTQEAVDLIATTPEGHVLVVECTAGVIKADKIAQLSSRVQVVRERLDTSGSSFLQVVPMLCTNLRRNATQAGIDAAEKLGILVACREDIDTQLERTLLLPEPEKRFAEAVKAAADAKARHTAALPF